MQDEGQAAGAVRLVEHWYRHHITGIVEECRHGAPQLTGSMLAVAHELAWRHAVVAAARECDPTDWQAMTVHHEAAAYESLLGWMAVTYGVPEGEVRAAQTTTGYRKLPR